MLLEPYILYPVAEQNVGGVIYWRNKMLLGVMCLYPAAEQNVIGAINFLTNGGIKCWSHTVAELDVVWSLVSLSRGGTTSY